MPAAFSGLKQLPRSHTQMQIIYISTWAGLTLGAAVYVIALIVGSATGSHVPDIYLAGSQTVALGETSTGSRRTRAEAIAELATRKATSIRNDIYRVREQVSALRSRLDAVETNTIEINKKISSIKDPFGPVSTAALPAKRALPATFNNAAPLMETREQTTFKKKRGSKKSSGKSEPPHLAELPAGIVVRKLPLPETGFGDRSDAPPLLKVAARSLANRITFGVYLGSGTSIDKLRSDWDLVRARYAAYLSELEGHYNKVPSSGGPKFQLIAGPFSNVAAAIRLCIRLKAGKSFCEPTVFTGKAL